MPMRAVLTLARKDLLLHRRGVAAYTVGYAAAAWVLLWLLPPVSGSAGPPAIMFPIALYFVLVCAGWLVDRERSRETFAFLRALPVSDLAIVASKFAAYFVMQVFGFAVALLVSPLGRSATPVQLVTAFAVMYLFGGLVLAVQLCFAARRAVAGPLLLMVAATAAAARIAKAPDLVADAVRLWADPQAHVLAWGAIALVICVLVLIAWLRLRALDTRNLIG
jgi:hypothetical protein